MKKTFSVIFLATALLVMSFSLVMAKTGKANVEGQITAVDENEKSITIQTTDGGSIKITFEGTFGFKEGDDGQFVHVKGQYLEDCEVDGCVMADWAKIVDPDDMDDDDCVDDDSDGICDDIDDDDCVDDDLDGICDDIDDDDCVDDDLDGICDDIDDGDCVDDDLDGICDDDDDMPKESAYCPYEVGGIAHPGAIFLANRMGVDVEVVMEQYCNGFGLGQIKLALHTEDILGVDHEELLTKRTEGMGWGKIWQEYNIKGKPKESDRPSPPADVEDEEQASEEEEQGWAPPGQAKKDDQTKVPPGQEKKEDQTKVPPGQEKKGDKPPKVKNNKKDK